MLENIFKLKENGTNVKTEVIAGITTFMTMAYILAVNPSMLTMPLMYSIAEGITMGVISYVVINLICGKGKKITPLMYILAVLFICKYIFL